MSPAQPAIRSVPRHQRIGVAPSTIRIGAEISGVDLAEDLSDDVIEEVRLALAKHQVIFFRDQHLDHESHKAFGRRFGELFVHNGVAGIPGTLRSSPSTPTRIPNTSPAITGTRT